jgi:hypothetical protein
MFIIKSEFEMYKIPSSLHEIIVYIYNTIIFYYLTTIHHFRQ